MVDVIVDYFNNATVQYLCAVMMMITDDIDGKSVTVGTTKWNNVLKNTYCMYCLRIRSKIGKIITLFLHIFII